MEPYFDSTRRNMKDIFRNSSIFKPTMRKIIKKQMGSAYTPLLNPQQNFYDNADSFCPNKNVDPLFQK